MKNVKNFLPWALAVLILAALIVLPFAVSLLISFKDFSPARGVFGSPTTDMGGLYHYYSLFTGPYFWRLLRNILFQDILPVLLSGLLSVFLAYGLAKIPQKSVRYLLLGMLGILYVIPNSFWFLTLSNFSLNEFGIYLAAEPELARLFVFPFTILRTSFLPTLFGVVLLQRLTPSWPRAVYAAALIAAPQLVVSLTANVDFITMISYPSTYGVLDTLSSYAFRVGFINGNYSLSAVVSILIAIIQVVFAIGAFFIMKRSFQKLYREIQAQALFLEEPGNWTVESSPAVTALAGFVITVVMAVILALIYVLCAGQPYAEALSAPDAWKTLFPYLQNSFISILFSILFFVPVTLCLAYALHTGKKRALLAFLLTVACATCFIGIYLLFQEKNSPTGIMAYLTIAVTGCISPVSVLMLHFWMKLRRQNRSTSFLDYIKQAALPLSALALLHAFTSMFTVEELIYRRDDAMNLFLFLYKSFSNATGTLGYESANTIPYYALGMLLVVILALAVLVGSVMLVYKYSKKTRL